ncbi:MAG TPA: cobalamin B12-binding domain-containing protein, partial [Candidatus Omnitrophota bacterium]|nr:cobalamin B12-binding domain-containing protein [Candidatus Omnitrophota bacterium]
MKNLRIVLVNVGRRAQVPQSISPPLGIMYLGAYLRSKFQVSVRIIDQLLDNSTNQRLVKTIADCNPDVVGLSAMIPTAHNLPDLTRLLHAALPRALVVLGGGYVTSFAEKALHKTAAHAAVPGEGERPFEEIIRARFDGDG